MKGCWQGPPAEVEGASEKVPDGRGVKRPDDPGQAGTGHHKDEDMEDQEESKQAAKKQCTPAGAIYVLR